MDATELIERLGLRPHPEGGWYAETWREPTDGDARPAGTAIHFLLAAGERSHWHRVDATEIWHFHGGAPLELRTAAERLEPGPGPPGRGTLQQCRPGCSGRRRRGVRRHALATGWSDRPEPGVQRSGPSSTWTPTSSSSRREIAATSSMAASNAALLRCDGVR